MKYTTGSNTLNIKPKSEGGDSVWKGFVKVRDTFAQWGPMLTQDTEKIPAPSDAVPKGPGTPAPGTSNAYSREDHVHPLNLSDAVPKGPGTPAPGTSNAYSREDHVHPLNLSDATNSASSTVGASSKAVKAAYDKASAASAQAETVKGNYTGNGGNIAPKDLPTYTVQFNMMSEDMPNQATLYKDCLLMNCYVNSDVHSKTLFAISKPTKQAEASSIPVQAWIAHAYKDAENWQTRIASLVTSEGGTIEKGPLVFQPGSRKTLPSGFNSWAANLWFYGGSSALYHDDSGLFLGFHSDKNIYIGNSKDGKFYANINETGIHCNADSANKLNTARTIDGIPFDGTRNITLPNTGVISSSINASGYVKFACGLILQWGEINYTTTVVFPIAFPNSCYSITALADAKRDVYVKVLSATQAQISDSNIKAYWLAIGH